ncbi:MAG: hypothetical protein ACFE9N_14800 [Promethearchaeota archaeon]
MVFGGPVDRRVFVKQPKREDIPKKKKGKKRKRIVIEPKQNKKKGIGNSNHDETE